MADLILFPRRHLRERHVFPPGNKDRIITKTIGTTRGVDDDTMNGTRKMLTPTLRVAQAQYAFKAGIAVCTGVFVQGGDQVLQILFIRGIGTGKTGGTYSGCPRQGIHNQTGIVGQGMTLGVTGNRTSLEISILGKARSVFFDFGTLGKFIQVEKDDPGSREHAPNLFNLLFVACCQDNFQWMLPLLYCQRSDRHALVRGY